MQDTKQHVLFAVIKLGDYTFETYELNMLSKPSNASGRRDIVNAFRGKTTPLHPRAYRVSAIRTRFYLAMGVEGSNAEEKNQDFINKCKKLRS